MEKDKAEKELLELYRSRLRDRMQARTRNLPGSLRSGETASDNVDAGLQVIF